MLGDGLAAAERAGNRRNAALGYREECVDNSLTRYKGHVGRELLCIGSALSDRPLLHEGECVIFTVILGDNAYRVGDGEIPLAYALDRAGDGRGNHYFVVDYIGLLDCAEHVAALDPVARLDGGNKVPAGVSAQGGDLYTPRQAVAHEVAYDVQRALDTVEYALDEAGAELNAQRLVSGFDGLARAYARGLLIDLDRGSVAVHFYYFTDQTAVADTHDVKHIGVSHAGGNDERTGDLSYNTFTHISCVPRLSLVYDSISEPTAFSTHLLTLSSPSPVLPLTPGTGTMAGSGLEA